MNLLTLKGYDVLYFDSSIHLIGASKDSKYYRKVKGKLCKCNTTEEKAYSIALKISDDLSADIDIYLNKDDFVNIFGFLPKISILNSNFNNFIPKKIHLESILNFQNKSINWTDFEKTLQKAFCSQAFAEKINSNPSLERDIKFKIEVYITLKIFDSISTF